jgi:hypothetical protein
MMDGRVKPGHDSGVRENAVEINGEMTWLAI